MRGLTALAAGSCDSPGVRTPLPRHFGPWPGRRHQQPLPYMNEPLGHPATRAWGTKARRERRSRRPMPATSMPSRITRPAHGSTMRYSASISVDLPHPVRPAMPSCKARKGVFATFAMPRRAFLATRSLCGAGACCERRPTRVRDPGRSSVCARQACQAPLHSPATRLGAAWNSERDAVQDWRETRSVPHRQVLHAEVALRWGRRMGVRGGF